MAAVMSYRHEIALLCVYNHYAHYSKIEWDFLSIGVNEWFVKVPHECSKNWLRLMLSGSI